MDQDACNHIRVVCNAQMVAWTDHRPAEKAVVPEVVHSNRPGRTLRRKRQRDPSGGVDGRSAIGYWLLSL